MTTIKKLALLSTLLIAQLFSAQENSLPGVGLQSAEYFESYDQQVQSSAQKPDLILHNDPTFFTGKHYDQDLGAYVFKYRNYSPDSNCWTSADPSGFPDGPNNYAYAPVPTSELDLGGLLTITGNKSSSIDNVAYNGKSYTIETYSIAGFSGKSSLNATLDVTQYTVKSGGSIGQGRRI